jgi:hypothetical protein
MFHSCFLSKVLSYENSMNGWYCFPAMGDKEKVWINECLGCWDETDCASRYNEKRSPFFGTGGLVERGTYLLDNMQRILAGARLERG